MRTAKRIICIILMLFMFASMCFPTFAYDSSSKKEEVVYILTNAKGEVEDVYVVNSFGKGDITDYGDYSNIKVLTSSDKITQDGDKITFSTNEDKVYYQGDLNNPQIPWNITLNYYLDGHQYEPSELAGKNGNLKIHFKVTKNEKYTGDFYENYALQAAFLFDTNLCTEIVANGATIANIGNKKQLSYTILPGNGIDAEITAKVTDFEMEAVSINGIKLNLNIDIDNMELSNKIDDLINGIVIIDDSANSLQEGALKLKDSSYNLADGILELSDGVTSLDDGLNELQVGIINAQNGIKTLNSNSEMLVGGSTEMKKALSDIQLALTPIEVATEKFADLTSASSQIKSGINSLYDGIDALHKSLGYAQYKEIMSQNGLNIDILVSNNTQTILELSNQIEKLNKTLNSIKDIPGYETQIVELKNQISQLENIVALLKGNNLAIGGTQSYLDELSKSIVQLYDGVAVLKEQYNEFDTAVTKLVSSLSEVVVNMSSLCDGINKLVDKYTELDVAIVDYTNGVASIAAGYSQMVNGLSDLTSGSKSLRNGSNNLYSKTIEFSDGMTSLYEGSNKLSDGTSTIRDNTSNMNTQIEDKIDELLGSINGGDSQVVSFVSDKNTNVESVQFVIKSKAIEKEAVEEMQSETVERLSFWQKLLRLFRLY